MLDIVLRLLFTGIIIYRNKSSSPVRLGWVIVVLLIPFIGMILYLLFGEVWRDRGRLARHKAIIERVRKQMETITIAPSAPDDKPQNAYSKVANAFEFQGAFPFRQGNQLQLFSDPKQTVLKIAEDIDQSKKSCHLLFYIWLDDNSGNLVANALIRARQRGVECRVLVDAMGSAQFLNSALKKRMDDGGVEVVASFPLSVFDIRIDHRNHRKIIVIDGNIGWTGSRNLADAEFRIKPDFAPWVDIMVRIYGPSVYDLQIVFIEDWLLEQDVPIETLMTPLPKPENNQSQVQVFASGPTLDFRTLRQIVVISLFIAKRELIITTPYFVPDEASITAYCGLARSGTRTILILPKRNDSRLVAAASHSFYQDLLDAGVEIYEYRPGLLHSKTITIDGQLSILDTANFDRRSFELNYEISFATTDITFTSQLRDLQMQYISDSDRIDINQWSQRSSYTRFIENTARLFAPIL